MNQYFNSVHFFKCNDLVTENCLFVSLIDFRLSMSYHYNTKITFYFLITIRVIEAFAEYFYLVSYTLKS